MRILGYYQIKDDKFFHKLIGQGVDTDNDGIISPEEAEVVSYLFFKGDSIEDLTGIEAFINLDTLICVENMLTYLDVSMNTKLTSLYCWGNALASLDISQNLALKRLDCSSNRLSNLDVSNNTNLELLYCYWNHLSSLDVTNNSNLEILWCQGGKTVLVDHPKPESLTTRQIIKYTFKGCDTKYY